MTTDQTSRRRVLLTGATGYIAGQLLPAFRERYDLTLVDVRGTDGDNRPVPEVELLDPLDDPDGRFDALCRGVDTVVHCGHLKTTTPSYAAERRNVDLTARVYEAAQSAGVRRVVVTSTNQASKWYERPWREGLVDRVGPEDYPRPDTWYGWAKVAYESMGFLYATGQVGPALSNVQIRIVVPRPVRGADFADRPDFDFRRDLAGYISPRDLQQLYVRSIEAESVADEHGVPFQIFYGVSDNARTFWSTSNARRVVGYAPQDDSEREFAEEIRTVLGAG